MSTSSPPSTEPHGSESNAKTTSISKSIHVVILCAKFDEAEQLRQVFRYLQLSVHEASFHNIIYDQTVLTDLSGHIFTIDIYSCASRSGSVITATMTSQILERSKPHWLFMTGVCAGNPNKVHLGDLLIAERVFDLRQGKALVGQTLGDLSIPTINTRLADPILRTAKSIEVQKDGWKKLIPVHRPVSPRYKKEILCKILYDHSTQYKSIPVQESISDLLTEGYSMHLSQIETQTQGQMFWNQGECATLLIALSQGATPRITYSNRSHKYYLDPTQYNEISNLLGRGVYPQPDPLQPQTHLGVIATDVSTVRADLSKKDWEEMSRMYNQRNLIGLEMEGYGLYETVKSYNETHHEYGRPQTQVILMKGVSDVGDPEKDDQFHDYGKQISGAFMYEFLRKYGYQMADKKNGPAGEADEKKI